MKKIDLHTHTVSSISDKDFNFSLEKVSEYVEKLKIDALAITNHNLFDLGQYFRIKESLDITVFPGIEIDLERGHILLITEDEEFETVRFFEKCKMVSDLIKDKEDYLSLDQFHTIFPELDKYLVIPHYDKKPIIKDEIISAINTNISAGEVTSISKFKRAFKNEEGLVPVLFSDIRFHTQLETFPTRHTFVDLEEITLTGIKSCLFDRNRISLTKEDGNEFFQATDDGLMLSTKLNIILGERSSGKTFTLNKISASAGNVKYIKQFSLLQNDEEKFNENNRIRLSLIHHNYLDEFRKIIEDVSQVDLQQNHIDIENYLESLLKFASENEKKDLYSKCILFNQDTFLIEDISNLKELINSVINLIENKEYQDIIIKHLSQTDLKNLAVELIEKEIKANEEIQQKKWLNTLINDIKRELRIKTTGTFVEEINLNKIALDQMKVVKFEEVTEMLKNRKQIDKEDLGKFSVITSTEPIGGASDLQKIGRDKKTYSTAFKHYNNPYKYLLKLKGLEVEDANLYKFFIKIDSITYNQDGFRVSGGERSEFNLIHEIKDATKYDMLLIDEPESSFDNNFLNKEINAIIKHISTLMPVVVVTHNSTVGASIKPNYLAITQKKLENKKIMYRIFTGYPHDKELFCSDGKKIQNFDALLNCLEAGVKAYNERKDQTYDILKDTE